MSSIKKIKSASCFGEEGSTEGGNVGGLGYRRTVMLIEGKWKLRRSET